MNKKLTKVALTTFVLLSGVFGMEDTIIESSSSKTSYKIFKNTKLTDNEHLMLLAEKQYNTSLGKIRNIFFTTYKEAFKKDFIGKLVFLGSKTCTINKDNQLKFCVVQNYNDIAQIDLEDPMNIDSLKANFGEENFYNNQKNFNDFIIIKKKLSENPNDITLKLKDFDSEKKMTEFFSKFRPVTVHVESKLAGLFFIPTIKNIGKDFETIIKRTFNQTQKTYVETANLLMCFSILKNENLLEEVVFLSKVAAGLPNNAKDFTCSLNFLRLAFSNEENPLKMIVCIKKLFCYGNDFLEKIFNPFENVREDHARVAFKDTKRELLDFTNENDKRLFDCIVKFLCEKFSSNKLTFARVSTFFEKVPEDIKNISAFDYFEGLSKKEQITYSELQEKLIVEEEVEETEGEIETSKNIMVETENLEKEIVEPTFKNNNETENLRRPNPLKRQEKELTEEERIAKYAHLRTGRTPKKVTRELNIIFSNSFKESLENNKRREFFEKIKEDLPRFIESGKATGFEKLHLSNAYEYRITDTNKAAELGFSDQPRIVFTIDNGVINFVYFGEHPTSTGYKQIVNEAEKIQNKYGKK